MGRPLQRSQEQLIPDKLSAGGSLVIRARPKEDESYLGFLLRLAEINSFDTPYWILKIMGAGSSTFRTYSAEASARLSLRLASLSKLSVKDLEHLYNHPVRGKYLLSFFDHPVPPYLLRPGRPRVCTKCLSQSQYCRKQWDFAAITSCPTHQIMLLEKCPGCGKPITWLRRSVSRCRCVTCSPAIRGRACNHPRGLRPVQARASTGHSAEDALKPCCRLRALTSRRPGRPWPCRDCRCRSPVRRCGCTAPRGRTP